MTATLLELAATLVAFTSSAVAAAVAVRARRQARALRAPRYDPAESREQAALARLRELFASDRIDLEQLERATGRVLGGLEPFPPVETTQRRPRSVLEAHGNAIGALIRASSPVADEAARIRADREARRAARERERWRH